MSEKAAVIKGHGHVTPNADGYLARCGGPTICKVCKAELAALKAQPSAVVLPPHCTDRAIPVKYRKGWNCCISEVARLNQPASAGDERAGWTEQKPTEEGAYWIRGNGLEANALVQVKQEEGELWCNLHMRNSEPVFEYGYTIEQLGSEFEWLGPLQASAALTANHSEQVLEGWQLVPVEATDSMRDAAINHKGTLQSIWESMLAAAPSAGSQKEQG